MCFMVQIEFSNQPVFKMSPPTKLYRKYTNMTDIIIFNGQYSAWKQTASSPLHL